MKFSPGHFGANHQMINLILEDSLKVDCSPKYRARFCNLSENEVENYREAYPIEIVKNKYVNSQEKISLIENCLIDYKSVVQQWIFVDSYFSTDIGEYLINKLQKDGEILYLAAITIIRGGKVDYTKYYGRQFFIVQKLERMRNIMIHNGIPNLELNQFLNY